MPETPTAVRTPQRTGPDREFTVAQRSQFQLVFRRFLQHRLAMASLLVLVLLVLLAYIGGWVWKYDAGEITPDNSVPPSWEHPFGTDAVGKDQFAQVLRGTRISLQVAVLVAVFATVVGTLWGAVAAYFGGLVDTLMMRVADLILTLPLIAGRGDARAQLRRYLVADRPGHRRAVLGIRLPGGPRGGAVAAGEGVRRGGPGAGRRGLPDHPAPPGAQRARARSSSTRPSWWPSRSCWRPRCPTWASACRPRTPRSGCWSASPRRR
jgi:hypothetical protein